MDIMLVTLLILVRVSSISGWRPFTVEFQNISLEVPHPEIIDANITTKNRTHDIYVNILRDISRPFLDFELLHDSGNGKFDMVYANKTIDLCMFLNNRKSVPMIDIVYKMLSDYSDLPKACPLRRKRYTILNATVDPEKFPSFLPDHISRASGVGWTKESGKKIIVFKLSFNVVVERLYKNRAQD